MAGRPTDDDPGLPPIDLDFTDIVDVVDSVFGDEEVTPTRRPPTPEKTSKPDLTKPSTTHPFDSTTAPATTASLSLQTIVVIVTPSSDPVTAAAAATTSAKLDTSADSGSLRGAAIAGIAVFAILAFLVVSCLAGFCLKRRHDRKKRPKEFARRPSYNPFRSASYSSANIPLTSDTSYSNTAGDGQRGDVDVVDDKASMFSRTGSASSVVSVYAVVPSNDEDHYSHAPQDPYASRTPNASSLYPVRVSPPQEPLGYNNAPQEYYGSNNPPAYRPQSLATMNSPISPLDTMEGRDRSRSSVSMTRFYDPQAGPRAM